MRADLHFVSTPRVGILSMAKPQYWLVKSEPDCFSIQHLAACPKQTTHWSGVRNYQARNFMKAMKLGDRVLYYHSSCDPPAVAGTAVVAREAYADHTALDPKDDHYDPKATKANPIWEMVDIRLDTIFPQPVPIGTLRGAKELAGMELLKTGSRLSVQPVREREFEVVLALAQRGSDAPAAPKAAKKTAAFKKPTKKVSKTTVKKKPARTK
jgi:predicted RNA-binding protein with PUA-like domain